MLICSCEKELEEKGIYVSEEWRMDDIEWWVTTGGSATHFVCSLLTKWPHMATTVLPQSFLHIYHHHHHHHHHYKSLKAYPNSA